MIAVAFGELLFGILNDVFVVYVSIFVGAIGVLLGRFASFFLVIVRRREYNISNGF